MNETYEDYLKAIYIISKSNKGGWVSNSEIASFLNVKPSSVTDMLYKLNQNNQRSMPMPKYNSHRYQKIVRQAIPPDLMDINISNYADLLL